jgi:parvulin-like peptidyl-prolyl isomerase
MDRQRSIGFGALFLIVAAIALLWTRIPSEVPAPAAAATPSAAAAAPSVTAAPVESASPSLEAAVESALSPEDGTAGGFDVLPDGRKAPPLPDSAPQQVTFGVVVFAYQGAQFATPGARTKEQAKQRALAVAADAKKDFSAAVAKGDHGSTSNAGRMPRGMLEPAAEYTLFTLAKGDVSSEPVDTPRGYWIVRRID